MNITKIFDSRMQVTKSIKYHNFNICIMYNLHDFCCFKIEFNIIIE